MRIAGFLLRGRDPLNAYWSRAPGCVTLASGSSCARTNVSITRAEQVAVAHHFVHPNSDRSRHQSRVDEQALRTADEPPQPIRRPGRYLAEQEEVG